MPPLSCSTDVAHRMILWARGDNLFALSDAELDRFVDLGIDGFACQTNRLEGLGGNPWAPAVRSSRFVSRCRARGLKLYAACYLVNGYNRVTPLELWFDDARWADRALPALRAFASEAHDLGFHGLAFDGETYKVGETRPTWKWSHPGNTMDEPATRHKVRQRGAEVMSALLEGFPGVELAAYYFYFPDTWRAKVHKEANGVTDAYSDFVMIDFYGGITSVGGWSAIRFWDSIFYKSHQVSGYTWDQALEENVRMHERLFTRAWPHYPKVAAKLYLSPFAWINAGPADYGFDDARSPDFVADQLAAFRRHGQGQEFAVYHFGRFSFDYGPYREAMRAASAPPC
jgi:hypothetical protein